MPKKPKENSDQGLDVGAAMDDHAKQTKVNPDEKVGPEFFGNPEKAESKLAGVINSVRDGISRLIPGFGKKRGEKQKSASRKNRSGVRREQAVLRGFVNGEEGEPGAETKCPDVNTDDPDEIAVDLDEALRISAETTSGGGGVPPEGPPDGTKVPRENRDRDKNKDIVDSLLQEMEETSKFTQKDAAVLRSYCSELLRQIKESPEGKERIMEDLREKLSCCKEQAKSVKGSRLKRFRLAYRVVRQTLKLPENFLENIQEISESDIGEAIKEFSCALKTEMSASKFKHGLMDVPRFIASESSIALQVKKNPAIHSALRLPTSRLLEQKGAPIYRFLKNPQISKEDKEKAKDLLKKGLIEAGKEALEGKRASYFNNFCLRMQRQFGESLWPGFLDDLPGVRRVGEDFDDAKSKEDWEYWETQRLQRLLEDHRLWDIMCEFIDCHRDVCRFEISEKYFKDKFKAFYQEKRGEDITKLFGIKEFNLNGEDEAWQIFDTFKKYMLSKGRKKNYEMLRKRLQKLKRRGRHGFPVGEGEPEEATVTPAPEPLAPQPPAPQPEQEPAEPKQLIDGLDEKQTELYQKMMAEFDKEPIDKVLCVDGKFIVITSINEDGTFETAEYGFVNDQEWQDFDSKSPIITDIVKNMAKNGIDFAKSREMLDEFLRKQNDTVMAATEGLNDRQAGLYRKMIAEFRENPVDKVLCIDGRFMEVDSANEELSSKVRKYGFASAQEYEEIKSKFPKVYDIIKDMAKNGIDFAKSREMLDEFLSLRERGGEDEVPAPGGGLSDEEVAALLGIGGEGGSAGDGDTAPEAAAEPESEPALEPPVVEAKPVVIDLAMEAKKQTAIDLLVGGERKVLRKALIGEIKDNLEARGISAENMILKTDVGILPLHGIKEIYVGGMIWEVGKVDGLRVSVSRLGREYDIDLSQPEETTGEKVEGRMGKEINLGHDDGRFIINRLNVGEDGSASLDMEKLGADGVDFNLPFADQDVSALLSWKSAEHLLKYAELPNEKNKRSLELRLRNGNFEFVSNWQVVSVENDKVILRETTSGVEVPIDLDLEGFKNDLRQKLLSEIVSSGGNPNELSTVDVGDYQFYQNNPGKFILEKPEPTTTRDRIVFEFTAEEIDKLAKKREEEALKEAFLALNQQKLDDSVDPYLFALGMVEEPKDEWVLRRGDKVSVGDKEWELLKKDGNKLEIYSDGQKRVVLLSEEPDPEPLQPAGAEQPSAQEPAPASQPVPVSPAEPPAPASQPVLQPSTAPTAGPSRQSADLGAKEAERTLTLKEEDDIKELLESGMKSAASVLETLLSKPTTISDPSFELLSLDDIITIYPNELGMGIAGVHYAKGIKGQTLMTFQVGHIGVISEAMMNPDSTPEPPEEITELHKSAIVEIVSQMMGNATAVLSNKIDKKLEIENPTFRVGSVGEVIKDYGGEFMQESIGRVTFNLTIEGLVDDVLTIFLPLQMAKQLGQDFAVAKEKKEGKPAGQPPAVPKAPGAGGQPATKSKISAAAEKEKPWPADLIRQIREGKTEDLFITKEDINELFGNRVTSEIRAEDGTIIVKNGDEGKEVDDEFLAKVFSIFGIEQGVHILEQHSEKFSKPETPAAPGPVSDKSASKPKAAAGLGSGGKAPEPTKKIPETVREKVKSRIKKKVSAFLKKEEVEFNEAPSTLPWSKERKETIQKAIDSNIREALVNLGVRKEDIGTDIEKYLVEMLWSLVEDKINKGAKAEGNDMVDKAVDSFFKKLFARK